MYALIGDLKWSLYMTVWSRRGLAVWFHLAQSGPEGFPFAVVKNHAYAYETAALYLLIFVYFTMAGGGKLSIDAVRKA